MRIHPLLVLPLLTASLVASEREFTYTTESSVLAPGSRELEIWNTYRAGKVDYYRRLDTVLEIEVGLAENVMGAVYLKYKDETVGTEREAGFDGIAFEGKWKLSDRVADPVGAALYFEPSLSSDEAALEFKGIIDKQLGALLLAANLVWEPEWSLAQGASSKPEHEIKLTGGASWRLADAWSAGLEMVFNNEVEYEDDEGEWEHEVSYISLLRSLVYQSIVD